MKVGSHPLIRGNNLYIKLVTLSNRQSTKQPDNSCLSLVYSTPHSYKCLRWVDYMSDPIQWHLHRYWIDTMSYGTRIPVPYKLNCHLKWWGCKSILDRGTDLHTLKPEVLVFTDASTTGWGAHCQGEDIQGSWDKLNRNPCISISWNFGLF